MFLASILTLIVGGLIGWWIGQRQARNTVTRQWMTALESAVVDNIIDQEQRSTIIRIQGPQGQA
jgi:membrane protein DedA with SNARE-associated domain